MGSDVRGVAVNEAARIMVAAAPDEILVAETTRLLVGGSSLSFDDRGMRPEGACRTTSSLRPGDPRVLAEPASLEILQGEAERSVQGREAVGR